MMLNQGTALVNHENFTGLGTKNQWLIVAHRWLYCACKRNMDGKKQKPMIGSSLTTWGKAINGFIDDHHETKSTIFRGWPKPYELSPCLRSFGLGCNSQPTYNCIKVDTFGIVHCDREKWCLLGGSPCVGCTILRSTERVFEDGNFDSPYYLPDIAMVCIRTAALMPNEL